MSELLVERGQIPGDSPQTLTGLDFALHDPRDRFSVLGLRMCGGGFIVDRKDWEPVCFISADEKGQDNYPPEEDQQQSRHAGKSSWMGSTTRSTSRDSIPR